MDPIIGAQWALALAAARSSNLDKQLIRQRESWLTRTDHLHQRGARLAHDGAESSSAREYAPDNDRARGHVHRYLYCDELVQQVSATPIVNSRGLSVSSSHNLVHPIQRARFKKRNNALAATRSISASTSRRSTRQPGSSQRYKEQALSVAALDPQHQGTQDMPTLLANSMSRKPSSRSSSVKV